MKTLLHWFYAISIALIFYNCTGNNSNINNNEQSDYYAYEDTTIYVEEIEDDIYAIVEADTADAVDYDYQLDYITESNIESVESKVTSRQYNDERLVADNSQKQSHVQTSGSKNNSNLFYLRMYVDELQNSLPYDESIGEDGFFIIENIKLDNNMLTFVCKTDDESYIYITRDLIGNNLLTNMFPKDADKNVNDLINKIKEEITDNGIKIRATINNAVRSNKEKSFIYDIDELF